MDALTFGMSRLAEDPGLVLLAAQAITVGVIVNSLFKAVLALVLGSTRYRLMTMLALLAQAAAAGGGFWLLGWLATK